MTEALKAPVVVGFIEFIDDPGTEPQLPFETSGAYNIVMTVEDAATKAGVVFGSSLEMDTATAETVFPISSAEWTRFRVAPSAQYISVIGLNGASGTLLYYIEGQTEG